MYQGSTSPTSIEISLTESHKFDALESEYSADPDFDPTDDAKKLAKDSTYALGTCKGALKELEYIVLFEKDDSKEYLIIKSIQARIVTVDIT